VSGDPLSQPAPLIRRVYSYVAYRIGDGPEAEDVTSDVFERALRYRSKYDAAKGTPQAWLLGIARTCVADHFAGRADGTGEVGELASRDSLEGDTVDRLTLRDALSRLTERDRDLIALRYGADLKTRDIADLLGERANTIEVALHRALARLRAELEPDQAETGS
jgi:RNA polymerase sigma-70 factor, ECF subfamily